MRKELGVVKRELNVQHAWGPKGTASRNRAPVTAPASAEQNSVSETLVDPKRAIMGNLGKGETKETTIQRARDILA